MKYIDSVQSYIEILSEITSTQIREFTKRIWFRGQGDKDWLLLPKVYRDNFMGLDAKHDDKTRRVKERHLTQDFKAFSAGIRATTRSDLELYCLQQHYGMPTRLLDWTTNPLVALYFATGKASKPTDGIIYTMDAYVFPKVDGRGIGIASSRSPIIQEMLEEIFDWKKPKWTNLPIIPLRPDHFDSRIGLQHGCFTFHSPNCREVNQESSETLAFFGVKSNTKDKIRSQLNLLGINDFTAYGDLENLARKLKQDYSCE